MEIQKFIQLLAEQYDDIDADLLTPETNFKELEAWSSLVALSIIAMVDEEYGVVLKGDDIKTHQKIIDLYNTILSRK